MNYRQLGRAGLKISEISLGGWLTFGDRLDARDVGTIVAAARDGGVNFIDLADVYARGEAERVFGQALRAFRRQDLVISSKVFWPTGTGPNDRGLSRKHIFESIDGSLERLGTDYVDIYFCHRYDPSVPMDEIVMAMDDLVRAGKVLYWGTSVWPSAKLAEGAETARRLHAHPPRVEQPRYNMVDRHIEPEILPTAAHHGMGLVVWSPLAQGILTGKYKDGIPDGSRAAGIEWVRRNLSPESIALAERVAPVAEDLGLSRSQLALAWCLRWPEVTSVITGASTPEQIVENIGASGVVLEAETLERLEGLLGNKPVPLNTD